MSFTDEQKSWFLDYLCDCDDEADESIYAELREDPSVFAQNFLSFFASTEDQAQIDYFDGAPDPERLLAEFASMRLSDLEDNISALLTLY